MTNIIQKIEQDVETFIAKIVAGVEHEIPIIVGALNNVFALIPVATRQLQTLAPFIESLGAAAGHPEVVAGVEAANVAMAGLNQFMTTWTKATTGGGITATDAKAAVLNAYQAYRNVGATYNAVKATAVQVATQPASPAPVVTH